MTEEGKNKVKRALELQNEISKINKEIYRLKRLRDEAVAELTPIMENPYIYDKVEGLKQGGIL